MATSTYGTPYVQGSDLVSAYPTVSSSLATRVDEVSYRGNGLNAQTGTTYTLVVGDAGKTITLSNASPVAVTLPQDSTADLPDGAVVTFYNLGAGTVTISQGTGATLQGGSITLAQYAVTTVIKLSANTYGRFDGAPPAGLSPATPTSIANSGGTATLTDNTVTFSGITSVSLNGCFVSTLTNYRCVLTLTSVSADVDIYMRFRVGGTDNSAASYHTQYLLGASTTVAAAAAADNTKSYWYGIDAAIGSRYQASWDICRPFETNPTQMTGLISGSSSAGTQAIMSLLTTHSGATSFDGFSLIPTGGTITGSVSVYGYK